MWNEQIFMLSNIICRNIPEIYFFKNPSKKIAQIITKQEFHNCRVRHT